MRCTVWVAVCLCLCWAKKKVPNKFKVKVLTIPEHCTVKSQPDNKLAVHFTGKLKNGTVFDSNHDRNMPFEFTLGGGQVVEGWEEGLKGMCIGEKRRLTVPPAMGYGDVEQPNIPPQSTLIFEVELLKINGQGAMLDIEGSAGQLPDMCDACSSVMEEFFEDWADMMNERHKKHSLKGDGGQFSLTYDDSVEERVWAHCDRKSYSTRYPEHYKGACKAMLKDHKVAIVGQFLSANLNDMDLPQAKKAICHEKVKACAIMPAAWEPAEEPKDKKQKKCSQCLATTSDWHYLWRQMKSWRQKDTTEVWDTLQGSCATALLRHTKGRQYKGACDELLEEKEDEVMAALMAGTSKATFISDMCSTITPSCKLSSAQHDEL